MDSKLIVIAIGGNSLIEDKDHVTVDAQYKAASKTAYHIADLIECPHDNVVGNVESHNYLLTFSRKFTFLTV